MSNRFFKPPAHLIKQWPEVFEDLYMNAMPLFYLNTLTLKFNDGRIWEIDVKTQVSAAEDPNLITNKILDILEEYELEINDIHFDVDTDKLKKDVENKTRGLLG